MDPNIINMKTFHLRIYLPKMFILILLRKLFDLTSNLRERRLEEPVT